MISEKRLNELINQGATIWVKNQYCNAYDVELNHLYFIGITDNKQSLLFLDYSIWENAPEQVFVDYLENLYETKEDAEWASIAAYRTEIFEPPTWEDFLKMKEYRFISYNGFREKIYIEPTTGKLSSCTKFIGKPTKENYIKACEMARKLFLGEIIKGETK